jgi:COP9 signalosome complex subunit 7
MVRSARTRCRFFNFFFPFSGTAAGARKLKHLTIVTLAARHGKELSYDILKKELDLESLRELEDLVLDAIYQGLIEGKIDQQKQKVYVDFAIGRDVREGDLLRVQEMLSNWVARSGTLIKAIEDKIAVARTEIKAEQLHREDFDRRVKEIKVKSMECFIFSFS